MTPTLIIKVVIVTIFLMSITSGLESACLTSSEDYAVEVVVPGYNLEKIKGIAPLKQGIYTTTSQYNPEFLALFQETTNPRGLSIKIQTPTELKEIIHPRTKIVSSSANPINIEPVKFFAGWESSCNAGECVFVKQNLRVFTYQNNEEAAIEINGNLSSCTSSCSGVCFNSISEVKCIDSNTKREFETILRYTNVSSNLNQFLESYRISGTEETIVLDIIPKTNPYINWKEAIKQELVFLDTNQAIALDKEDIEDISSISKLGRAGQNYRIVKNESSEHDWLYYDKTQNPILSNERDCKAYVVNRQAIQLGDVTENLFYSVPAIILATGIISLLVLLVIAQIRKKLKGKI